MKVMYLIWSLGCGGAEKMVCSLALDHGPDVEPVVCCLDDDGYYAPLLRSHGIKVLALNKKRGFDPAVLIQLRAIVRRERIDLVNSHLWSANLYARLLKFFLPVPVVTVEHNVDLWKKWYHILTDRFLASRSDFNIFVSQAVREFYRRNVPNLLKRHSVIYNGIDLSPYRSPGSMRSELLAMFQAPEESVLLVNVGRLVPAKNQAELIRVTQALVGKGHHVYTLIVGDGPLRGELQEEIERCGMERHVALTGTRDDVAMILKSCDLFVLTSSWEGLPLVIIEAMSAGTPPVFYDVGGTKEIVRDGIDGIKIASGNFPALVESLERLLSDRSEIRRLVDNIRSRGTENFDAKNMVSSYETTFRKMLATPRAVGA